MHDFFNTDFILQFCRCSQPRVGVTRQRCREDELLLRLIGSSDLDIDPSLRTLCVVDARPKINAIANVAKGLYITRENAKKRECVYVCMRERKCVWQQ